MSKLSRHISKIHKDVPEVKEALLLPRKCRMSKFDVLKKRGILNFNKNKLLQENPLFLRERKADNQNNIVMCDQCHGFFAKTYFARHVDICKKDFVGPVLPISIPLMQNSKLIEEYSVEYRKNILSTIRDDVVGTIAKTDKMILTVGARLYDKSKRKMDKVAEVQRYVRSEMRRLANVYNAFKSQIIFKVKCGNALDMLLRENFDNLRVAIESVTAGDDGEMKGGLKYGLYYLIRNSALIWKATFLVKEKDDDAKDMENFLAVFNLWKDYIFGDATYHLNRSRQIKLRKPTNLPLEEDVAAMRTHVLSQITKYTSDSFHLFDQHSFVELRNAVCVRLTMFNARRGGEPARLLIQEWRDAEQDIWIDKQRIAALDPIETALLQNLKIMYQGGKGNNHLVPIIIPNDSVKAMSLLCDPAVRSTVGVHETNRYVFASTHKSERHVSGWHTVENLIKDLDLVNKSLLTATQNRHRVSTLYASLDLPEKERDVFYRHMGHSREINENIYQIPMALQEITKVGKTLIAIDEGE